MKCLLTVGRRAVAGALLVPLLLLMPLRVALAVLAALGIGLMAGPVHAAPLRLAVADVLYAAPVLIADAAGFFKAEGLDLTVTHYTLGRPCLEALLDGRADIATVADTPIMFAGFQRRDFQILATFTLSGRENQVVARTDHGVQSAADLRGRRLGVFTGTSGHYYSDTFLLFHGLKPGEVIELAQNPDDRIGPLLRGEIDAAALFGTYVTEALNVLGPKARVLPNPNFVSVLFNLVTRPASAGFSDDDAFKLLRAVRRGIDLIHHDPARAKAIMARLLKLEVTVLDKTWSDFDYRLELAQSLVTTLEAEARWALRRKFVPPGEVPDYLDLVRLEPLRRVDPRAVRIVK
jgi:NitT/TauT family transport system substrate-binding protein